MKVTYRYWGFQSIPLFMLLKYDLNPYNYVSNYCLIAKLMV